MEDNDIKEAPKKTSTRRSLGRQAVATTALVLVPLISGAEAASAASHKQAETEVKKPSMWDEIDVLAGEVAESVQGTRFEDQAQSMKAKFEGLRSIYGTKTAHLEKIWELVLADTNDKGEPRLLAEHRKWIGGLSTIRVQNDNPIIDLANRIEEVPFFIRENLRRLKQIKIEEQQELFFKWFDDENNSKFVNLPGERTDETTNKKEVSIKLPPDMKTTPQGLEQFEKDAAKIAEFLEKFPFYKKLYSKVILISSQYGESSGSELNGAIFQRGSDGTGVDQSVITINLDHFLIYEYNPEIAFAHEAFGHGTDVELNVDLASRLSAADYIERLVFQKEILNNPDWGAKDKSIQELFAPRPVLRQDKTFLRSSRSVGTNEFMSIITEYPMNLILNNSYIFEPTVYSRPRTICDEGMGVPNPGKISTSEGTSIINDKIMYPDLSAFLGDYMLKLQRDAQSGNVRSGVILWGLKNFPKELGNLEGVWTKSHRDYANNSENRYVPTGAYDSATTWSNYCNFVVINAVLYHAFSNKVTEVTSMFTNEERQKIEERVLFLRKVYRREVFAEGAAYSHYFGNRMKDKPPYRNGLEHVADMIEKSSA